MPTGPLTNPLVIFCYSIISYDCRTELFLAVENSFIFSFLTLVQPSLQKKLYLFRAFICLPECKAVHLKIFVEFYNGVNPEVNRIN